MTASPLARAERFVWLCARVLEQHRFAYHFLGGPADAVEGALAPYRNADGGFGHGLDPDLRGPVSQPLHTVHALRVLDEIGRCGGQQAERVCRYLTSVSTPEGALPLLHHSLRGYPYAPGRMVVFDAPGDLLSTAPVVGLLHRAGVWHAWLFRATDFCWARVEALGQAGGARASEVVAAVAFLDHAPDRPRAEAAAHRLGRLVRARGLAVLDPDRPGAADAGADGERCAVHEFVRTPASLARRWFTDAELERSLDHLAASQQDDGGWPAPGRAWAAGPHLERRPVATIDALLTLRAHDRLPVVTR